MVDKVLTRFPKQQKLAESMVKAVDQKLNGQPDFSKDLEITGDPKRTADTTRAAVEFLVVTMIAEAAQPADETKPVL